MARHTSTPDGFSAERLSATVGAAQRAGLSRGLSFALMLALSGLTAVYGPLACGTPAFVTGP